MSPSRLLSHWRGLLLSLVGIAAIAWLAATGRLGLYIHPRYFVFTIVMAVIAGVVAIVAFALLPGADEADDDHDHDHNHDDYPQRPWARRWSAVGTVALVVVTAGALLLVPPTTLTTSTVENRAMNASAADSADAVPQLVGGDSSAFTVKDWAGLLRSGADPAFLADAEPTVVGFVTPDPDDPENVFYVARFIVTCCAVDAQPVGVPIYLPGWQDEYPVDSWVEATGRFVENPSTSSMQPTVLDAATLAATTQPADPYVY